MWPPVPRSTSAAPKGSAAVDDSAEVDVEHPVVLVAGCVEEHPGLPDAGVVDHDVGQRRVPRSPARRTVRRPRRRRRRGCTRARRHRARRSGAAVSLTPASSTSLITSSAPSRANSSAVARPIPLPAPVTETSVSPKYSRRRPTCARSSDRLAGLPSRKSTNSCTDRAIVDGCDIGDQWPAWMSRRHNRGTHLWVSA